MNGNFVLFLFEQELLDRVFGELVLVCENCISNIVVKVYEAEQLQEDILVRSDCVPSGVSWLIFFSFFRSS